MMRESYLVECIQYVLDQVALGNALVVQLVRETERMRQNDNRMTTCM